MKKIDLKFKKGTRLKRIYHNLELLKYKDEIELLKEVVLQNEKRIIKIDKVLLKKLGIKKDGKRLWLEI